MHERSFLRVLHDRDCGGFVHDLRTKTWFCFWFLDRKPNFFFVFLDKNQIFIVYFLVFSYLNSNFSDFLFFMIEKPLKKAERRINDELTGIEKGS